MKRLFVGLVLGSLVTVCHACKVEVEPETFGLEVKFEVLSLSIGEAAEIARGKDRYEAVLKKVESGRGKLEKVMMVSGSGLRMELEEVKEFSYPSEFEPARWGVIPTKLPEGFVDYEKFVKPARVSGYEMRYLGDMFEVNFSAELEGPGSVSGEVRFDHVALQGSEKFGKGISAIEMPVFDLASFKTELSMMVGTTVHVGTVPAPGDGGKGKVWMGFITVEFAKK